MAGSEKPIVDPPFMVLFDSDIQRLKPKTFIQRTPLGACSIKQSYTGVDV